METTVLVMYFLDQGNKKVSISMADPRVDLSDEEVKIVMTTIITQNVFTSNTLDLVAAHSAQIVTRTVNGLDIE